MTSTAPDVTARLLGSDLRRDHAAALRSLGARAGAVTTVPDDRWGETVKAVVVPAAGAQVDPADLIEHSRRHLAGYKCPTSVDVVDALPRKATGKVLRRELREPYWAGRDRRV